MPKKIRGIKKPKKQSIGGRVYKWKEIEKFINDKYQIDLRDVKGKYKKDAPINMPYCDLWNWLNRYDSAHNGSFLHLFFDEWIKDEKTEPWVKDILRLLKKEFSPKSDVIRVWVEW